MMDNFEKSRSALVEQLSKQRESLEQAGNVNPEYMDASFILGTTCIVERFFSTCKYVLTDNRASMTPWMFETIVFLKTNGELWGILDMAEAIMKTKNKKGLAQDQADYEKHLAPALAGSPPTLE